MVSNYLPRIVNYIFWNSWSHGHGQPRMGDDGEIKISNSTFYILRAHITYGTTIPTNCDLFLHLPEAGTVFYSHPRNSSSYVHRPAWGVELKFYDRGWHATCTSFSLTVVSSLSYFPSSREVCNHKPQYYGLICFNIREAHRL